MAKQSKPRTRDRRRHVAAQPVVTAPARESTSPNLGTCLRRLRFDRRLSIADVSVATGIAKSTLSRVENDQLSLTYAKLLQLCAGLQIDLPELFAHDREGGTAQPSGRRTYTPAGAGKHVAVGSVEYTYLCTDLAGKKMTPMLGRIKARTREDTGGLWTHDGEEFSYVVSGTLELHTEFYEPLVVETGGSVYFDSTMGHSYVSIGDQPLVIMCVCSTPEVLLRTPETEAHHGVSGSRRKARSAKS